MMRRGFLVAAVLATIAGIYLYKWDSSNLTPKELFEKKCSICHKLPDAAKYKNYDFKLIVKTMREFQGADQYISKEEGERIAGYLNEIKLKSDDGNKE